MGWLLVGVIIINVPGSASMDHMVGLGLGLLEQHQTSN